MKRVIRRILIGGGILVGALVLVVAVTIGPSIYRLTVGLHRYEAVPPVLPAQIGDTAVLIFSKTNGFRDDPAIEASNAALSAIAKRHGWSAVVTENGAVFNSEQLRLFKAVVWNNTSGDVLTAEQREAFKNYLESGGSFLGIHGAGGDPEYSWRWYVETLIGAQFIGHTMGPHFQEATVRIEDNTHPATRDLGTSWVRTDEWYSFASSPRAKGYHVLASVDESTYHSFMNLPLSKPRDIHMVDHPVVWVHCVGNGRAFYSALGHSASTYAEPKHIQLLDGAMAWAMGLDGSKCVDGREIPGGAQP
jgi:uncharacterized protein